MLCSVFTKKKKKKMESLPTLKISSSFSPSFKGFIIAHMIVNIQKCVSAWYWAIWNFFYIKSKYFKLFSFCVTHFN